MRIKSLVFGGETFKIQYVKDCTQFADCIEFRQTRPTSTLWQCYNKPSKVKESIWNDWQVWSELAKVECFTVDSYNCNVFSLGGIVSDVFGNPCGIVRITKTYNILVVPPNFNERMLPLGWRLAD